MDRFRRQAFLTWLALFAHLFIGYGGAEAGILCIDAHHVSFEASNHGRSAVPVPAEHKEPVDEQHGDHCVDVPLSIGVSSDPIIIRALQASNQPHKLDLHVASLPVPVLEKNRSKALYSSEIDKKSYHLSSLSSIILLI